MPLLLVRHGESEGNVQGLIQGQVDLPLTEAGRTQAAAAAARLEAEGGAERIVASPLTRAFETATIIASALGLTVATDDRLKEYDFGAEVSGLTIRETIERFPRWRWLSQRSVDYDDGLPGEEGVPVFNARVFAVVDELAGLEGRTIAVTHGGVVMTAVNVAINTHRTVESNERVIVGTKNCAITEIARDGEGRLIVRRHNDACHVPGDAPAKAWVDQAGSSSAISQL